MVTLEDKKKFMTGLKDLMGECSIDTNNNTKMAALVKALCEEDKPTMTVGGGRVRKSPIDVVEIFDSPEYHYYAIVGENGYALLRSYENCVNQLNYYTHADAQGFEYAEDAMDWIIKTFPGKAFIRSHKFCSLDYMLKYENFWLRKGKREDI